MKYTFEQISQINNSIPIVEYVSQYLDLDYHNGEYWAVCPFHDDLNASISFNAEKNVYKCFGCDSKGYLINFVMQYHKFPFLKAIEHILQLVNIDFEKKEHSEAMDYLHKISAKKSIVKTINRTYLKDDVMNQYIYKPIKEWLSEGVSQKVLDKFQVRYDEKKNSIVFPIKDKDGRIISIKSRTLIKNHADMGVPKYIYYNPIITNDFLFGLYENINNIITKKEVIVVESEKGVMILDSFGFSNVVALSTKSITVYQVELLLSLKCNIIFAFDKDVKEKEVIKIINQLSLFTNVEYILDKEGLLNEKDSPYDKGIDIWRTLYEGRYKLNGR